MATYDSTHTGSQVDTAVSRALSGGTIDDNIALKQNKLSTAQLAAVNSGITASKVSTYDGYQAEIDEKQDALPTVVKNRYLHSNSTSGALEWVVGTGSTGTTDYTDLSNKPKINNVELSGNKTTSDLGISYDDLEDLPDIPEKTSDLTNDSGFSAVSGTNDGTNWQTITIDGTTKSIPSGSESAIEKITIGTTTAAEIYALFTAGKTVFATAGDAICYLSYSNANTAELVLIDAYSIRPYTVVGSTWSYGSTKSIPTVDQTYSASSTNAQSGTAVASAISGKQDTISAGLGIDISDNEVSVNPSEISYNDLADLPTIDQTYSASSTNAQSGVAVASAISGKENIGKITVGGVEYSVTRKALVITDGGTSTTYYVADITA